MVVLREGEEVVEVRVKVSIALRYRAKCFVIKDGYIGQLLEFSSKKKSI